MKRGSIQDDVLPCYFSSKVLTFLTMFSFLHKPLWINVVVCLHWNSMLHVTQSLICFMVWPCEIQQAINSHCNGIVIRSSTISWFSYIASITCSFNVKFFQSNFSAVIHVVFNFKQFCVKMYTKITHQSVFFRDFISKL